MPFLLPWRTLLRHYMPRPLPSYWIWHLLTRQKMNMFIFFNVVESKPNRSRIAIVIAAWDLVSRTISDALETVIAVLVRVSIFEVSASALQLLSPLCLVIEYRTRNFHVPVRISPFANNLEQVCWPIVCSNQLSLLSQQPCLTFQGHVTSSITWLFDSPYVISYRWPIGT